MYRVDLRDLGIEPATALGQIGPGYRLAEIHFADDREHRHFEQDRVQPRPLDRDVDLARHRRRRQADEAPVELEQAEQIDEVALEETPAPQVFELFVRESQGAQCDDLALDLIEVRCQVDVRGPAFEAVFDLRTGKMVQHDLHHRELVQIGIEQRLDDHAGFGQRLKRQPWYPLPTRLSTSALAAAIPHGQRRCAGSGGNRRPGPLSSIHSSTG
jgi:hypothetical protein